MWVHAICKSYLQWTTGYLITISQYTSDIVTPIPKQEKKQANCNCMLLHERMKAYLLVSSEVCSPGMESMQNLKYLACLLCKNSIALQDIEWPVRLVKTCRCDTGCCWQLLLLTGCRFRVHSNVALTDCSVLPLLPLCMDFWAGEKIATIFFCINRNNVLVPLATLLLFPWYWLLLACWLLLLKFYQ